MELKDLKSIDKFTTSLNNEEELKMYLFNQGLIESAEINKKLYVMYKMNGEVKKLPITYSDMIKYLDEEYLRANLKVLAGSDIEFLEKLARHFSIGSDKFNPQGLNVQDIRVYISDVRKNDGKHFYSKALEVAIDDLFYKATFKLDQTELLISNEMDLSDKSLTFDKGEITFSTFYFSGTPALVRK